MGVEELVTGQDFFDVYDFAVAGTVTAIRTDEVSGSATYGATDVIVDVIAGYGTQNITSSITISQSDPGWLAGYFFEVDKTYFIPVVAVGPNEERDYSHLCDPISEITAADAAELPAIAIDGISIAYPSAQTEPTTSASTPQPTSTITPPELDPEPSSPERDPGAGPPIDAKPDLGPDGSSRGWWFVAVGGLIASVLGTATVARRRNGRDQS
jgi:hypothetical protein